jgi:hypothetical protein
LNISFLIKKYQVFCNGINCPIYVSHILNTVEKILNDILKNSYQKLDIGGKVLFPSFKNGVEQNLIKYFQEKIKSSDKNFVGFAFEIVSIDKFPYIIGKNNDFRIEEYYVFTKIF